MNKGIRTIKADINGSMVTGPDITAKTIWLKTDINVDGWTMLYYGLTPKDFTQLGGNCELSSGYWKGSKIGLFTYNTGTNGGYADFSEFRYSYDGPASPEKHDPTR